MAIQIDRIKASTAFSLVIIAGAALHANAQSGDQLTAESATNSARALDEIVVTAEKRSESMSDEIGRAHV